ncbi:DNA methylase [Tepidimonas fonticaldi]|uniref:site-specific DNA-methyltransferase (adenine-specific) n=1 Tax=Tepidimonas fonticaldi TaxID=1101373 RepID=A0A554XQX1_9BURK|nr:site-specific DNA-methyltransferase [Tepidimonas fonticaldi]TSE38230.1 DNA methylase [Tepidimonas fonticaldi]
MSQKYEKLKTLLKELFQLDQPELDFGIYRILHARSAEVTQFLDKDLLPQVKQAFAQYRTADKAELEKELATGALEAEVYDHLYSFFRRYYSEGDFLSKRVYKPGVYAIPYEGEEVKLHWANADQYYIKTSESFRDYAFRLRPEDERNPMRVHFRLVDAAEGEHGNVKEQAGKERRFRLAPAPFAAIEDGELVIRFTYAPDLAKQKDLNAEAEAAILALDDPALADWIKVLGGKHVRADGTASENTRLRVHLDRYTARNTFDYFIHKDLGGFLRRELDFYIKNEVMHLDDVENETAPRVEQYLSKIKVIRRIAHKIIDFLAQLEDFQKKLWLKKKFVVETSYCIRLGVIPEEFYPEIAANDAQREEWVRLCAIDEIKGDLTTPGYSVPLTVEFLKAHPTLMVDTRHFDADLTTRLLEKLEAVEDKMDGLLVHSENFSALAILQLRYRNGIKCAFIDPPYNTEKDRSEGKFVYKDGYTYSSWIAMLASRLLLLRQLLRHDGGQYISIDDVMYCDLVSLLRDVFGRDNHVATIIWEKVHTRKNSARLFSVSHDYIPCFAINKDQWERVLIPRENTDAYTNPDNDPKGPWKPDPIYANNPYDADYVIEKPNGIILRPPPGQYWRLSETTWKQKVTENAVIWGDGAAYPMVKRYLSDVQDGLVPVTLFDREFAGDNALANSEFDALFGSKRIFPYPKPSLLIQRLLQTNIRKRSNEAVIDYFAGSGTTGHAVINLNREDGGQRKFILVEQADYFDTVLLPRLKKVVYTPDWRTGKPKRFATPEEAERSPRIMKVIRLESYEDTLNNLELRRTEAQQSLLDSPQAQGADGFREQYLLRYMLDVETRGSQSLLNVAAFMDPTAYRLKVKRPGSDESREVNVDLQETFNWLIGLKVDHIAAPRTYSAAFRRDDDPDLPADAPRRLLLDGRLKEDPEGPWWFRTVTGTTPDGRRTLVIWRKRPGGEAPEGIERDNLVLDEWFRKQGYSSKDSEFDLIYVNGDNNLENLKAPDDTWKVRLIEEDFFRLMFEMEGV